MPLDSRATQTTATNSATYLVNSRRRVFATGASGAACCGASALACRLVYSLVTSGSFAAIQYPPNGCDQTLEFDRFGVELLAPRGNRLLALAGKRMCGQGDDGNVLGLRVAFQTPRGFPAVNNRHFEVHQDNIRPLGRRHLAPFLTVRGRENLARPLVKTEDEAPGFGASALRVGVVAPPRFYSIRDFTQRRCSASVTPSFL